MIIKLYIFQVSFPKILGDYLSKIEGNIKPFGSAVHQLHFQKPINEKFHFST